jgi:hypothetical protein
MGNPTPPAPSLSSVTDIPDRSLATSLPALRGALGIKSSQEMVSPDSPAYAETSAENVDSQTLLFVAIAKGDLAAIEASEDADFLFLADGSLKAASLDKLVSLLPLNSEPYYLAHFLITYRSFCSPDDLFYKLQQLWEAVAVSVVTSHELELFRIKFMNVLKTWIDKHFYDFNPSLLAHVQQFLERHQEEIGPVTCHSLKKLIKRSIDRTERRIMYTIGPAPVPIIPSDMSTVVLSVCSVDPMEIARQMCLRDEQIYKSIRPRELMNQSWNKSAAAQQSPNVLKMIDRFNRVSGWVQRSIVSEMQPKQRKTIITAFISIAARLRELHNFHSLLAVIAALESASVTRMKKTFELLKSNHVKSLLELKAVMSAESSYKAFRGVLRSEDPPRYNLLIEIFFVASSI